LLFPPSSHLPAFGGIPRPGTSAQTLISSEAVTNLGPTRKSPRLHSKTGGALKFLLGVGF
jgi:hypothetical protein